MLLLLLFLLFHPADEFFFGDLFLLLEVGGNHGSRGGEGSTCCLKDAPTVEPAFARIKHELDQARFRDFLGVLGVERE